MEAPHPLLQPTVVGVHVVDVEIWRFRLGRAGRRQDMELDPGAPSECGDRCTSIAAQFRWPGNDLPERDRDAGGVEPRQNGIDGRASAVAGDDDRDLLRRQAPLGGFAARLRGARGRSRRLPLKDSRMKVSSASTIPVRRVGLSRLSADRNRCLQRNAVV